MTSHSAVPTRLDRVGFFMSTACAVHCALMPAVAGLLPLIGLGFLAGEAAESVLLTCAAVIAVWSLAGGCRHHKQRRPIGMMVAGFALILIGRFVPEVAPAETPLVVTGALLIAGAHLSNRRLCCATSESRLEL